MRAFLICFMLMVTMQSYAASKAIKPPVSFDLESVSVSQLMRLVYDEAYPDRAFFLDPAILKDDRQFSFRYKNTDGDVKKFLADTLRMLGYSLEQKNNSDIVRPIPQMEKPSVAEDASQEIFYYRPKFRDGAYLIEILTPLFKGKFTSQRAVSAESDATGAKSSQNSTVQVAPSSSALAQIQKNLDQLIFAGSSKEVAALKKLLGKVDIPVGQVEVKAILYEVSSSEKKGSALQLVGSILKNKLSLSVGGPAQAADNFVSLKIGDLGAIGQALDSDSRFKVLSSPSVRVISGKSASFTVGEDVPVLGAVVSNGSTATQSVDYKSSGVLFSIKPEIKDAEIDVQVDQQVSNFVTTTTGVNNSPTLTKRQLQTSVSVTSEDVIVIGGLKTEKNSASNAGLSFLPSFFGSSTKDNGESEIILFLLVRKL